MLNYFYNIFGIIYNKETVKVILLEGKTKSVRFLFINWLWFNSSDYMFLYKAGKFYDYGRK